MPSQRKSSIKIAAFLWDKQVVKQIPNIPTRKPTAETFTKIGVVLPTGFPQAQELRIIERLDVHIRQLGKTITSRGWRIWFTKTL